MSENNPIDNPQGTAPAERPDPAEAKRLAARRRFLQQSAAGSGAVVFTLYHAKAYATGSTGKKLFLSSSQACRSLTGNPGKQVKVQDSVNPKTLDGKKNFVYRWECTKH